MLTASDLHAEYGDNTIFEGLSLTLSRSRRVGLVGPNGAGKTTLLRLLAGVEAPRRGHVTLAPGDRIGYLPQEPPGADLTIDRLLGPALGDVWRLRDEVGRLEPRLHEPEALAAYGEAQERFDALGGWALQAQLDGARDALGIAHVPLDASLGGLSGGEAARALLAGVLLARPTVLLLDEPTNHLDLDGLAWLEAFLAGFDGEVLVVSHDRRFLDETVSQILELERGTLTAYEGGYTAYREEKARRRERLELDYEAQQKRRRRLEADIAATRGYARRTEGSASGMGADKLKRYAKKVARKAQARERRLERELHSESSIEKPRRVAPLRVSLEGDGGGRLGSGAAQGDGGLARTAAARRRADGPRPRPDRDHRAERRGQDDAAGAAARRARADRRDGRAAAPRRGASPGRGRAPGGGAGRRLRARPRAGRRERGAAAARALRPRGRCGRSGR